MQWKDCKGSKGNVLATFRAFLSDVLYPDQDKSTIAGVDIDLLMDATKSFPVSIKKTLVGCE